MRQIYSHPGTDVNATFGTDQKDTCISVSSSTHFFVSPTENWGRANQEVFATCIHRNRKLLIHCFFSIITVSIWWFTSSKQYNHSALFQHESYGCSMPWGFYFRQWGHGSANLNDREYMNNLDLWICFQIPTYYIEFCYFYYVNIRCGIVGVLWVCI